MKPQSEPLRIVTLHPFTPAEVEQIKGAAPRSPVDLTVCQSREEFDQKSKAAEVIYGDIRGEALRSASRLKWVQAGGAGLETLDPALREHPAILTNFAATFAPAISETAIGMLLCLTRGISRYYMPQFSRREWKPVGTVKSADHVEISGRTMGIVGLGGIGAATTPGEAGVKIYMRVDDLDAYLDRAEKLGGQRVVPPTDLPGDFGRFAIFTDPDGNPVGLWA